ncbi:restriction endonuclease subunit S [Nodularia chucula]|uniref:restriction endonuclease subunit S n=1 Tax=Nodularia chucula TaxID=3093667 RepID=UPI0039C61389
MKNWLRSMREKLDFQIPEKWLWSTFGDICSHPQYGYTTKAATSGTIKLLRTTDITSGKIDWLSVPYCSENPEEIDKFLLEDGDIIISRAGSIGVSYLLKNTPEYAVFASYLIRFKPFINKQFFKLFLESPFYWQKISESKLGIAVLNVNANKLKEIPIPVPPLNEQVRIVAKVYELFSELDNGIQNLKMAREQIKVYRQAILTDAFEGNLTAKWRKTHANQLGNAPKLIRRITQEREQLFYQKLDEWEKAVAVWEVNGKQSAKPRKPQKPTKLLPLTEQKLAELPQIPDGWCWVRPEEVCSPEKYSIGIGPFGSNLKVSDYRQSGIPLIFVKNITNNDFDLDLKYISEHKFHELQAHTIQPFDIVITKMGNPPGDVAIYPNGFPVAVLTADCLKFRVWNDFVNRNYFKYCIESNLIKKQIGLITKGVAQKKISTERFKTLCFPLPSREEQDRIVLEIEKIISTVDILQFEITNNLQKSEAFRYSILKKAFSGQLVSQDPNDEPASILLERIRVERETTPKQTRKRLTNKIKQEKSTMPNLINVLKSAEDWLSAKDVFRQCGIRDGTETKDIEKLYLELRDLVKEESIKIERRGDEDWLCICSIKEE